LKSQEARYSYKLQDFVKIESCPDKNNNKNNEAMLAVKIEISSQITKKPKETTHSHMQLAEVTTNRALIKDPEQYSRMKQFY
jgi:hypothetical protein